MLPFDIYSSPHWSWLCFSYVCDISLISCVLFYLFKITFQMKCSIRLIISDRIHCHVVLLISKLFGLYQIICFFFGLSEIPVYVLCKHCSCFQGFFCGGRGYCFYLSNIFVFITPKVFASWNLRFLTMFIHHHILFSMCEEQTAVLWTETFLHFMLMVHKYVFSNHIQKKSDFKQTTNRYLHTVH